MSKPKLKIHADRRALAPGQPHNVMLFPFWGKNPEDPGAPDTGRFDEYAARGGDLFEMTPLEDADVAILAGEWKAGGGTPEARAFCERARVAGKRVIIFFNSDSDEEIPVEGSIIFRTSGRRSRRSPNVHGFPAWCEDFVKVYRGGAPPIRQRRTKPMAGYCGYGAVQMVDFPPLVSRVLRRLPLARRLVSPAQGGVGARLRSEALSQLARSPEVETNFLLRETFWAGAIVEGRRFDLDRARRARIEYVENMFGSDYILCARGTGNFSFRLYETLCSGRIPLFVDTDCLMPHDRWINWSDISVWVDESEVRRVAGKLAAFHARLSTKDFEARQQSCRRLWLDWLAPMGFFSQLHRYLD